MIRKLKLLSTITVDALRANRSLRVQITGEISAGLRGDLSGLRGDIDECEISGEDRENGVRIADLVEPAE